MLTRILIIVAIVLFLAGFAVAAGWLTVGTAIGFVALGSAAFAAAHFA